MMSALRSIAIVGVVAVGCSPSSSTVRLAAPPARSDAGVPAPDAGHAPADAGAAVADAAVVLAPDAAVACVGLQQECSAESTCCNGFCDLEVYGPPVCEPFRDNGMPCIEDGVCASGACVNWTCAEPECVAPGGGCMLGGPGCCSGFCLGGYIAGTCLNLREIAESCETSEQCVSGSCQDGACRNADCNATEGTCWGDGDCCSGACSFNGNAYGPGHCLARRPAGEFCAKDLWCLSAACTDGVCN